MTVALFTTLPDTIIVDEQQAFQVCTVNSDPLQDGVEVRIFVTLSNLNLLSEFTAFIFDPSSGMFVPIEFNEFGVAILESTLAPTSCSQVLVTFTDDSNYRFQQQVVEKSSGKLLASNTQIFRVLSA
ncbi:hypothetical protein [Jeotgalibacillus marinus]|uniref:Exosporium protein C n=1 Tax=Jeotgalibacillus marinus TaxID=86667 RepID=A0ABV3PYY5_9BACL